MLQESEVRPVGATQPRKVDVRILCATNRLARKRGCRRSFPSGSLLSVEGLSDSACRPCVSDREDIGLLARTLFAKVQSEMKSRWLVLRRKRWHRWRYNWPSNVRELENEVQRLVIQVEPEALHHAGSARATDASSRRADGSDCAAKGQLKDMMEEVERFFAHSGAQRP